MKVKFTPVERFYDKENKISVEEIGVEITTPFATREVQMRFDNYVLVRADVIEYGEWIVYDIANNRRDAPLFFKDYGAIYDEAKEIVETTRKEA